MCRRDYIGTNNIKLATNVTVNNDSFFFDKTPTYICICPLKYNLNGRRKNGKRKIGTLKRAQEKWTQV